jgi:hypothetical protein
MLRINPLKKLEANTEADESTEKSKLVGELDLDVQESDDSLDDEDNRDETKALNDDGDEDEDDDDDDDNRNKSRKTNCDSDEEERLENLVFGSKKTMFKTMDNNKLKTNNKKRKNKQIADHFEKRKAVWEDEDDNQM